MENIEFESEINKSFKKECLKIFEAALDRCANHHEIMGRSDQPGRLSLKFEYYFPSDNLLLCSNPVVEFNKSLNSKEE